MPTLAEPRRDKAPVDKEKVARLRKQGVTLEAISQRMGISPSRVTDILKEMLTEEERTEVLRKYGRDR